MDLDAKLGLDVFKIDEQPHIEVDQERCQRECEVRYCLYLCPAKVYNLGPQGEILIHQERCLECGTCTVACPEALHWNYPRGGFGVQYRFG